MTRIAILSDVHANLPALEGALLIADEVGAERLVVAGDLVGDGPHPVEVVARLRERGAECIRGNVDRQVLELATGGKKLKKVVRSGKGQKSNRAWAALQLRAAPTELEWLASLPAELRLRVLDQDILVVHGSPRGDTDYIFPSLTPAALARKLEPLTGTWPSVLVSGHSHLPFAREVGGVLVANPGSVGRPADGDPRGTLLLIDAVEYARPLPRLIRFTYPLDHLLKDLDEREVPGIDPEEYHLGVKG